MYTPPEGLDSSSTVASDVNFCLDEFRRGYGVNGICQMKSINNNGVFAYEIVFEAESFDFAGVDVWQGSAVKGVAEKDLGFR